MTNYSIKFHVYSIDIPSLSVYSPVPIRGMFLGLAATPRSLIHAAGCRQAAQRHGPTWNGAVSAKGNDGRNDGRFVMHLVNW